jgi:GrpB-like predicted nucleotidyltransferase (UPF0157 family)
VARTIEIIEYDLRWPEMFADIATRIGVALGPLAVRIEHVGSTAVPGLAAKPARRRHHRLRRPADHV